MTAWYGSITNIPPYVYPTDYVSDYMVDVVVVAGDWSNYQALSVDKTWSKYFDATGLLKNQVQNFINDRNVTLLKYYQGLSFIPYFRDSNNQNIFIETVINQDTQITGLFCAFNADLLDTDFPTGAIDLIGNNLINTDSLVDSNSTSIDFLSYNESLISTLEFKNTILDAPGNVIALDSTLLFNTDIVDFSQRSDNYAEDTVSGVLRATSATHSSTAASVAYNVSTTANTHNSEMPYAIIGGNIVYVTSGPTVSISVSNTNFASKSATASYYTAIKLDTNGSITNVTSTVASAKPTVAASDIILGYMYTTVQGGNIVANTVTDVTVATASYLDLEANTDYTITSGGSNNTFTITFTDTAVNPATSNYEQYRRIKRFNSLRTLLQSVQIQKSVILLDLDGLGDYKKISMANMGISVVTSTSQDKSITIQTNLGLSEATFAANVINGLETALVIYANDNELILSDNKMVTTTSPATSNLIGASAVGVVGQFSTLYQDFYNGVINSGDYFYANVLQYDAGLVYTTYTASSVSFVHTTSGTYSGLNFVVIVTDKSYLPFDDGSGGNKFGNTFNSIVVPDSMLNMGKLTIASDPFGQHSIGYNYASALGYTQSYTYAYLVGDSLNTETIYNVTRIWDADTKYYLAMDIDSNNNLTVNITGDDLYTYQGNLTQLADCFSVNTSFYVNSFESDYQETVEIVVPTGYTQVPNQILVNAARYSNIIVGDFLLQDNTTAELEVGQQAKNLTRILSKRVYSGDSTLALITCDAAIYKFPFGNQASTTYQTMRYSSLDNYVSTYKAIPLKGFRIRQASLPDGTEAKQNEILNLVAKGTPLYNAIINKDALDFRYLIDSFGLGLTEFSKQQLSDICGGRLNCLGFINMPSMKSFRQSSSPKFTDANGVLQTSYIAQGGDLESNPAFLYSMAEGAGTTCVGYFAPYLTVNDNGAPLSVPPAMFAASTYMRKFNTNVTSIVPWTIAAGTTNGLITGIAGVEMDFNPTDVENLNQAQFNPIILKKNRGWVIDTENTALTLYKSALSYLHVREVLIELENALNDMLLQFQWKFNTQDTRAEIKLRADVICAGFVNRNGLYNYFNKCDSENNTNTLIDNQIGVLDTYIEPIKGLAVIVNNITVLKTGAIASGGFQSL